MTNYSIITATFPDKESAKRIAWLLVEQRLAACVQMFLVESVYSWQGKICNEPEVLLIIKSHTELFGKIAAAIKDNHAYDVPEVVQMPIADGSAEYLNWIGERTEGNL